MEDIAAARTHGSILRGKFGPANIANWRGRKKRQRGAAKGTTGGKQSTTCCVHGTSKDAHHRTPGGSPLRRNNRLGGDCSLSGSVELQCVWVTAEDAPLSKEAASSKFLATYPCLYLDSFEDFTQTGLMKNRFLSTHRTKNANPRERHGDELGAPSAENSAGLGTGDKQESAAQDDS